jgi:hypothetical protein
LTTATEDPSVRYPIRDQYARPRCRVAGEYSKKQTAADATVGHTIEELPMTIREDDRTEAERLALLPVSDQQEIIALHRSVANNPKVPKRDRQAAADRADTLERHLRTLNRRKKKA